MVSKNIIHREVTKEGKTLISKLEIGCPSDNSLFVLNSDMNSDKERVNFINDDCRGDCGTGCLYPSCAGSGIGHMGYIASNKDGKEVQVWYTNLLSKNSH